MCGITLTIRLLPYLDQPDPHPRPQKGSASDTGKAIIDLLESFRNANAVRGPDTSANYFHNVDLGGGSVVEVGLTASVLVLRGNGLTGQPLVGKRGVLAWNGQVRDYFQFLCLDVVTRPGMKRQSEVA